MQPPIKDNTALQFKDYFNWLKSRDLQQARTQWLATTAKPSEQVLQPSADIEIRGAIKNTQSIQFSGQQSDRVAELCRQYSMTISELIQAVWTILLARLASQDKVSFVLTLSGRSSALAGD